MPKLSEEHKKKLSKLKLGKTYEEIYGIETAKRLKDIRREARLGYKLKNEIKEKISKSETGKFVSKETRKKLSLNHKGGHSFGYKVSNKLRNILKQNRLKQILPIKDTSIEVKIQNFLKQLGIDYFTHQYMHIKHGYQCDILIPSINIVIECDGDYWHKYPIGLEIDGIRTKELLEKGFKVLRLWEFEIRKMNINNFKKRLNNCSGGG